MTAFGPPRTTAERAQHGADSTVVRMRCASRAAASAQPPPHSTVDCVACRRARAESDFDALRLYLWRQRDQLATHATCEECIARQRIPAGALPHVEFLCRQCQRQLPRERFDTPTLRHLCQTRALWRLCCIECRPPQEQTRGAASAADEPEERTHACARCGRVKRASEFAEAQRKTRLRASARCFECQYPRCSGCGRRPERAYNQPYADGEYMCKRCGYPPCPGCGRQRPSLNSGHWHVRNTPHWRCRDCQAAGRGDGSGSAA